MPEPIYPERRVLGVDVAIQLAGLLEEAVALVEVHGGIGSACLGDEDLLALPRLRSGQQETSVLQNSPVLGQAGG